MDKKKKQLILIAILVPVLIYAVYNSVTAVSERQAGRRRPAPAADPGEVVPPAVPPPVPPAVRTDPGVIDDSILSMQETVSSGPWGRDPFRPPPIRESDLPSRDWQSFHLSGIIEGRIAVINGEPVAVGDEYQGYRLIRAERYRIILGKEGQTFTLNIAEE